MATIKTMTALATVLTKAQASDVRFTMTGVPGLMKASLRDVLFSPMTNSVTIKYRYGFIAGVFTGTLDGNTITGGWSEMLLTGGQGFFEWDPAKKTLTGEWGGTELLAKKALGVSAKKGTWAIDFSKMSA